MKTKWSSSDPSDWANESFAISEAEKTGYCVMHGSSCDRPEGSVTISTEYLAANEPIVKEQLQRAGVRLAALLDSIFAD
ncbi:S1/P1 nuclease [Bradyrhizobium glycinis]|uniref:S1/P1 nuclease n=1 Tax=Bradyrhizobium glycinis TaxID=2751812 RepID=UPI0024BFA633|nr:S1/P1 nuclease [Bradyrhizobium glycinis]